MPPAAQPWSLFYPPDNGELFPHLCEKASFSSQKSAYAHLKLTICAGTKMYFLRLNQNFNLMSSLLYAIAVILIIAWALGFFVYSAGGLIHILLVIAIVAIILRLIRGERI